MKAVVLHYGNTGIEVVTYTDAPLESGLGGSAAHAVAMIKAFNGYNKVNMSNEEVARLAYHLEREVLKLEGGYQDQWAAAFGGMNCIEYTKDGIKVNPIHLTEKDLDKLEKNLLLVFVPRGKSGQEVFFEERKRGPESIPILIMKRENIERLRHALENGMFDDVGKILHFDWKIKKQLAPSITTDNINVIYQTALDAGATGGRLIGAGAGGGMLFYCPGRRSDVLKALQKFGVKEIKFKFERVNDVSDFRQRISEKIKEHHSLIERIMEDEKISETIHDITNSIVACYRNGGKVVLFGNGGSAADAQHIVGELVNKFKIDRPMLNAMALTVNTSVLTAIANDSSYDDVFARQIESLVNHGDVVIGISTSGNASSVMNALKKAKERDATVIFFTGSTGGKICERCESNGTIDISLKIPSNETPHIQEAHIMMGHIICELVEHELYGK